MTKVEQRSGPAPSPAPGPSADARPPRRTHGLRARIERFDAALAETHPATFRRRSAALWMLLPTAVVLVVFLYVPMARTFELSLYRTAIFGQQRLFVGLENFARVFTSPESLDAVVRTAIISTLVIGGSIGIALLLAALMNQRIGGTRIYRLLLVWPLALSTAISGVVFRVMFDPNVGLINSWLEPLGIQPEWFRDPTLAQGILVMALIWNRVGFNLIFYTAAYQNLPRETLEAALVDGATPWQRFWRVTFPLLSPITLFLLVTSTIFAFFDAFAIAAIFDGGPLNATSLLIYEIYENAFVFDARGLAAAQSLLLFLAVGALTVLQLRQGRKRVVYQ